MDHGLWHCSGIGYIGYFKFGLAAETSQRGAVGRLAHFLSGPLFHSLVQHSRHLRRSRENPAASRLHFPQSFLPLGYPLAGRHSTHPLPGQSGSETVEVKQWPFIGWIGTPASLPSKSSTPPPTIIPVNWRWKPMARWRPPPRTAVMRKAYWSRVSSHTSL